MTPQGDEPTTVAIDGHRLKLTHLDKVLYPETGTTKGEVIGYYAEIAEYMVPHTIGRPATRKRWPNGVLAEPFFQKDLDRSTPTWVSHGEIEHSKKLMSYAIVDSAATLAWMGQSAALEVHTPQWRFDAAGGKQNPDRLVFDLDPGEGIDLAGCVPVAFAVRDILHDMGFDSYPVTSGSKGIHLYVPLDGSRSSAAISTFAKELAKVVQKAMPDLVIWQMARNLRDGKVFIDWSQNAAAKTTIAPYSLRGRNRPTVAAPRSWDELAAPGLRQLEFGEVLERARSDGDLLAGLENGRSAVPVAAAGPRSPKRPTDADPAAATETPQHKLTAYRAKRDAAKTPEPVPAEHEDHAAGTGDLFVIGEHHATALHWDFRLERDGVLVSWAMPKGVPNTATVNRMAIQTEDHPMEYATFQGTIPAREYGGGKVWIWDTGTYLASKWRDDEIMIELFGERVSGEFVLIRTDAKKWLMHRVKGQPDLEPVVPHAKDDPAPDGPVASAVETPAPAVSAPKSLPEVTASPMLASTPHSEVLDPDEEWVFEAKWDGIRALAEVADGRVRLTSRNDNDFTAGYPELQELADLVGEHEALIDGEIVALGPGGQPSFQTLQRRMHLTKPAQVRSAAADTPAYFYAFDLLRLDGISLLRKKYRDRRALLEALHLEGDVCSTPERLDGTLEQALAESKRLGLEGVVAKRTDSVYLPGQRGSGWLKFKHSLHQEVVIGGWRDGQGNRSGGIGALLVGVPGEHGLAYAGRVGTGFSVAALDKLQTMFKPLERKTSPFADVVPAEDARGAHWIRPRLVGEVEFTEWSEDGRLRHPVWRGLRPDKDPADVTR